ncbi:MAG: ArsR family transcriptional regulator [Candidatus Hodarchaeales archaeon]
MVALNDLISPTRIKILTIINETPNSLTQIAKLLELSKPEVSRHLTRMKELGLINKVEKDHYLTNLGIIVLMNLRPFEFIIENYEYFRNHQIIDLPESIIKNIDSLRHSNLVEGAGYIFKMMEKLNQEKFQVGKLMMDQPFPSSRQKQVENAFLIIPAYAKDENIDIKTIEDTCSFYEIRTLPAVNVSLGILDQKFGFLFFPDLNGKIDYNSGFIISDLLGIEFLESIWDYFVSQSKLKIQKVETS